MKLTPILDIVLIKLEPVKRISDGGIHLVGGKVVPDRGKVLAVGPGKTNNKGVFIPTTVKKGDNVLIEKYAPTRVDHDEEDTVTISNEYIMCVID